MPPVAKKAVTKAAAKKVVVKQVAKKVAVKKAPAKKVVVKKIAVKKAPAKKVTAKALVAQAARIPADDPLSLQRVRYLSDVFSGAQLAKLVGVSPSQTSRWARGKERPGPAAAPVLIDLEHVFSRARLVWGGDSARIWLSSANAYLGGARPLDVLITEGPARVLQALDAEMWGGAA